MSRPADTLPCEDCRGLGSAEWVGGESDERGVETCGACDGRGWVDPMDARRYLLDGVATTWAELEDANDPDVLDEIADLEVGEGVVLGQSDLIERVA